VQIEPKPPTAKGPDDWFTGDVFLDVIARGEEPSRVRVMAVRFTPSARTAWHSHAVGQTLYVTEGRGLIQARGGEINETRLMRSAPATSSPRRVVDCGWRYETPLSVHTSNRGSPKAASGTHSE